MQVQAIKRYFTCAGGWLLALKMRCNKLHARITTRQGRRPQARSVTVGSVGNGILVKKNLTGELRQRAALMSL
ncbi:hypothetical protein BN2476_170020 [Paraburkholderia piptadeniae]|uniref:Uncharacterized protein n=1 Tax=Paraburkholderia piptadeniae TaxID=1701573 RepID=A0A1N7RSY1_9BURK|nr:hypothetical protein BN2476_170020 [Paraburkholderia piptadeniae]